MVVTILDSLPGANENATGFSDVVNRLYYEGPFPLTVACPRYRAFDIVAGIEHIRQLEYRRLEDSVQLKLSVTQEMQDRYKREDLERARDQMQRYFKNLTTYSPFLKR